MAFVLTILLLPIGYFALPDSVKWRYTNRIANLFEAESLEEIDEGRVETAKAGWKMMFKHPLLGSVSADLDMSMRVSPSIQKILTW